MDMLKLLRGRGLHSLGKGRLHSLGKGGLHSLGKGGLHALGKGGLHALCVRILSILEALFDVVSAAKGCDIPN